MISVPCSRFTTGAIHYAIGGSHVVISDFGSLSAVFSILSAILRTLSAIFSILSAVLGTLSAIGI
ncbi:hypothetical protein [Lysinibacillus xylanilyticus]|uniref:hypothetical protein n=1 Tax=Lysinibacillus xylanilyticus TaxID=582475 RepID=UPI003CFD217E